MEQSNEQGGLSPFEKCFNCKRPFYVMEAGNPVRIDNFTFCTTNCFWSDRMDPHGWRKVNKKERNGVYRKRHKLQFADEVVFNNRRESEDSQVRNGKAEDSSERYREAHAMFEFHQQMLGGMVGTEGKWCKSGPLSDAHRKVVCMRGGR